MIFFTTQINTDPEALPPTLRKIAYPEETTFALHVMPLTPDLLFAVRALLASSNTAPMPDIYYQAKAVELMCTIISRMEQDDARGNCHNRLPTRKVNCLREARELIGQRYAEPITVAYLAKETGLGKTTLATGFAQLFGISIYDCIQRERMSKAYEMLLDGGLSITEIAASVGYNHSSNFSTVFRRHFGCSPKDIVKKQKII